MNKFFKVAAVAALALAGLTMNACSDSGGGSSTKSANFVDSAVAGISYKTSSGIEGVTDADGKFEFKSGDTVTFYIGGIELPGIVPLDEYLTPAHWAGQKNWQESVLAVNIARFLQTLDEDGNPNNGIQIPKGADKALKEMEFDFGVDDGNFTGLLDTLVDHLALEIDVTLTIVNATDAVAHLEITIKDLDITITVDTSACNMTDLAGLYTTGFDKNGAGPFVTGDYYVEFGSDRSLSIGENWDALETVATFCSFSSVETDLGPGFGKIVTETYTWVEGTDEIFALVITDTLDTAVLTVTVGSAVNGTFTGFSAAE